VGGQDDRGPSRHGDDDSLRRVLLDAGVGIWSWDAETDRVYWSDDMQALLGLRPAPLVRTFAEYRRIVHPDDRGVFEDMIASVSIGGGECAIEHRIVTADGSLRWLEARMRIEADGAGRPRRATGVFTDITERKREEQARRTADEMFSKVFHGSPDAITVTSIDGGRFIEVNESFARVSGYQRSEVLGVTSLELGLWADPADRARFVETLRERGAISNLEVAMRHSSGRPIQVLISAEVIDFAGEPNLLMIVRDVTDRKRAEEERTAMLRELEARNEELERYAYTLSHDLKSPLVTIRGFLGMLGRDLAAGKTDLVTRHLQRIDHATLTMTRLVTDLLDFLQVGHVVNPPEEVALGELAREAVRLVAGSLPDGRVRIEVADDLPTAVGDRGRLLEVLMNLVDNAVKFMGDQPEPRVEIGCRRERGEIVVTVRDNGAGIDPRYHDKVFGLFDRLDPRIEGTGVGLALVQRIVELYDGRVWVESAGSGQGCTFCWTIADLR
jgi:PAS domain S-box-containing protein